MTFDIALAIGAITATGPATLGWILLETDRNDSSESSFSSKDQDVLEAPTLVLEYCDG